MSRIFGPISRCLNNHMKNAYSYIRMSTEIQLHGDSLRRQLELSKNYAKQNGLNLVENLQDIGVSAFKGKNVTFGALGEFLKLVKDGTVQRGSYLLVESLDRLSRDKISVSLPRFIDLLNAGIIIVTLQDGQIYTQESFDRDQSQLFISLSVMVRAHEESRTKSKRLSAAWNNKRQNIDTKILTSKCPAWLMAKDDRSGFELKPEAAATIQKIFKWCLEDQGHLVITRRLNRDKVPTIARASEWNVSYVKKILKNPAAMGAYQPCVMQDGKRVPDGPKIEGYFPAVVSEADFIRAQERIIGRRGKGGRKGSTAANLFTHIARCGICGSPLNYIDKGVRSDPTLVCRSSHQKSGCTAAPWNYRDFEAVILNSIASLNLDDVFSDKQSDAEKRRSDELTMKTDDLFRIQKKHEHNLDQWRKLDDELQSQLTIRLKEETEEIRALELECDLLKNELDSAESSKFVSAKDNISRLKDELSKARNDDERFHIRSRVSAYLKEILIKISVHQGDVEPFEWNLITRKTIHSLTKHNVNTPEKFEEFMATSSGRKIVRQLESRIVVAFKNGANGHLSPFHDEYFEFEPTVFKAC